MCGILAIIGKGKDAESVKELSKRMAHRGPDESDLHVMENGSILSLCNSQWGGLQSSGFKGWYFERA
jgi:asparagine synthetase B (glutamine-hydrolysing)